MRTLSHKLLNRIAPLYCLRCGQRVNWKNVHPGWDGCCPGTSFSRYVPSPWKVAR